MKRKSLQVSNENLKVIDEYLLLCKARKLSENTMKIKTDCLRKLGDFIGKKNYKEVTDIMLQQFFSEKIHSIGYHDLCGVHFLDFYRWLFHLNKKLRQYPENMLWFEFTKKSQKQRAKDPDIEKYLITPEDYQNILKHSKDRFGMWEGFWECMWITGGRPEEIRSMKIKDVTMDVENNRVFVELKYSKKIPRKIPMMETPNNLIRWLELHPKKDDPESSLWLSHSTKTFGEQLKRSSINSRFRELKKEIGINKPISPKSFRKTRASLLFSARNKDGARIYDTKDIGTYLGWDWKTVEERRNEYDLSGKKEIYDRFFNTAFESMETYDTVKKERDTIDQKYQKEIGELQKELSELKDHLVKKTNIDNFIIESLSVIAKETMQNQGVEAIKEIFRKHNIPLVGD